jgi:hypothetical protein
MSESLEHKEFKKDEIDLLEVFRLISNTIRSWFRAIGITFLICSVFLIRRWIPLVLSIILAIGVATILKNTSDSSYTTDIVLRNNMGDNSDLISFINKLHKFCLESNSRNLSSALNLDSAKADNLLDAEAFWIIDKGKDGIPDEVDYKNKHNVYDTVDLRMRDRLDIRLQIKEPQYLDNIKRSLLFYVDSDSLFQQRNRLRLRQNNDLLIRINGDIKQLDSLQKVKYFEETRNLLPKTGGQMIFLQEQRTQLIYPDIYVLIAKKQALEFERDLYNNIVTVIDDFSVPNRRINGIFFYSKKLIPVFLILTLFVLIFIANFKKIKEIFNKY